MRCAWQAEIDDFCLAVLEKHWPDVPKFKDVRNVGKYNLEAVDVICGGFPCQDISGANPSGDGIKGQRSGLWAEMYRIICELRPCYVVVENVPAMLYRGMGKVLGDLASCGYDAEWECIPAAAFGAPHRRDRVFIVCYSSEKGRKTPDGFDFFRQKPSKRFGRHWLSESGFCRVVDGVSGQVDGGGGNIEVAALANAVVPQIAEWIGRRLMEVDGA